MYIINVLLIIVYWIAYTLLLDGVETKALIQSFFFGGTIVPAGWYLQELLLFYLIYWMTWKLFPKNYARIIVALIIVFIAIAIVKLQSHWYLSSFAFAAGIIYAKSKESIDYIICSSSNYKAVLLSSIIILIVVYMALFFFEIRFAFYTPIKVFVIAPLLPLILTLLSSRKKYKSGLFSFMGKYALEIYVLQGLAYLLMRNNYLYFSNVIFLLGALPLVILLSFLAHPMFRWILRVNFQRKQI